MLKITSLVTLVMFLIVGCTSPEKASNGNEEKQLIQQHTMAVLWFQQSAEMTASYLQCYQYARILLESKLKVRSSDQPAAIVLDIDETILDNSPNAANLIKNDITYDWDSWKEWTDQARAKALPGALDFLNYAEEQGVEIYYISNRRVAELEATLQNLQDLNFPNADSTHVLLRDGPSDKTERRALVSEKVNVLLYLGDNLRDYSEVFGERGGDLGKNLVMENMDDLLLNFVIFPNPTYGEWEGAIYGNDMGISDSLKLAKRMGILED